MAPLPCMYSSEHHHRCQLPCRLFAWYSATIPVVTSCCNHPIVSLYRPWIDRYAPTIPCKWLYCICRYIVDREWLLQVLLLLKTWMTTRRSLVVRLSVPLFLTHSAMKYLSGLSSEFSVHPLCTHTRRVRSDGHSGAPEAP